jgi:protein-disulfide isomerase
VRTILVLASLLAACGGAAPPPPANAAASPTWIAAPAVPFHTTLPNGMVIALDATGALTLDGAPHGRLHDDGRIEDAAGARLASLLADGRISFGGELTRARVTGSRLVEGGVAILELDQDRTLTIRLPDGRDVASVPVLGVTPESRATVLYVVAVHLLQTAQATAGRVRELLAREAESGVVRLRVPIDGRPARGPESAPVTIAMFDDFQCPFCGRAVPTLEQVEEVYRGRVRLVFLHNPLPFHVHAREAAAVAEEAFVQRGSEGFWAMYDILFANQRALETADLERYAAQAGLDVARLRAVLEADVHGERIDRDQALATSLGATGTPIFFVNGVMVRGAQPFETFRDVIDLELARAERLTALGIPPSQIYPLLMESARTEAAPEATPPPPPARPQPDPSAVYRVPIAGAPVRGRADALVTIVIFSDFQCPFCSRVLPTLERIEEAYGREVRFVFRHNPLPFHQQAMPAAEAAMEAFTQRRDRAFWQMHDVLFANQTALQRADLERYAHQLGLDARRFARALDSHTHAAAIAADQTLARELGASGTPSFFINGRNLRGAQPFESFEAVIDEELARARERVRAGTPRARVYEELTRDGATSPVLLPQP